MKTKPDFLFKSADIELQVFSRRELESYVQSCQRDCQTALIEIGNRNGSSILFGLLMVRGQLVNVYRFGDPATRLDHTEWFEVVRPALSVFGVRTLALTPHTMRLVKILIEQYRGGRTQLLHSDSLEKTVEKWEKSVGPVLLHLTWPGADGLALLPGGGRPPRHTLFLSADQVLHSAGGMTALYGWKEPDCRLRVYSSQATGPAWDEYFLHHAFVWQVSHLLRRFEELTGRLLVNTILREMNFASSAHGWNIMVSADNVTDQAVFSSPEQAGQVYRRLFDIALHHADTVLGSDLLSILLRESQTRLYAPYRAVYARYTTINTINVSEESSV